MSPPTVIALLDDAGQGIEDLAFRGSRTSADRELSVALTHIEDAKMRVNRGFAKHLGVFGHTDLQATA